uniref:Uncharacterized protein n=1 Tax=viral metagenome TaxID=1070528 RepID=A0A6M3LSY6_9ZZZZ
MDTRNLERPQHGGPRKGAGRKPLYSEPMQKRTVLLPPHHIAALIQLGSGNLAAGIRALVGRYLSSQ